jgi:hypothetical protein
MKNVLTTIRDAIAGRWLLWTATAIGFVVAYNVLLLIAVMVRFGELPNYVTFYDYFGNVATIIESTPAVSDMIPIIREEWLIEIGYMNYDYGNGISEWSMTVLPEKLAVLLGVGALIATVLVLLLPARDGTCAAVSKKAAIGAAGGGAALVGLSSATLSWVVCCAAPTWVVSLAMLGMGASLAFWLEPLGTVITLSGYALLILTVILLAIRRGGETSGKRDASSIRHGGMPAASS